MSTSNSPATPPQNPEQKREEAGNYLGSLLNKNFRITTTDSRIFWGTFKCTDPESNIVLQHTYEYRHPTSQQVSDAAAASASASTSTSTPKKANAKVKVDMTSRYLGLVVVPGKYIVRIEVEEFASQMRGPRQAKALGAVEQPLFGGIAPPGEVGGIS